MNVFQWLRYGPWLAQVVVTRRCNLKCGYCTEYDRTSDPVLRRNWKRLKAPESPKSTYTNNLLGA